MYLLLARLGARRPPPAARLLGVIYAPNQSYGAQQDAGRWPLLLKPRLLMDISCATHLELGHFETPLTLRDIESQTPAPDLWPLADQPTGRSNAAAHSAPIVVVQPRAGAANHDAKAPTLALSIALIDLNCLCIQAVLYGQWPHSRPRVATLTQLEEVDAAPSARSYLDDEVRKRKSAGSPSRIDFQVASRCELIACVIALSVCFALAGQVTGALPACVPAKNNSASTSSDLINAGSHQSGQLTVHELVPSNRKSQVLAAFELLAKFSLYQAKPKLNTRSQTVAVSRQAALA